MKNTVRTQRLQQIAELSKQRIVEAANDALNLPAFRIEHLTAAEKTYIHFHAIKTALHHFEVNAQHCVGSYMHAFEAGWIDSQTCKLSSPDEQARRTVAMRAEYDDRHDS